MLSITQNADIRYLGKLLGDVIRAYGGQQLFERTEAIRASSVERHRGLGDASALGRNLEALSLDETLSFVRGFMLFSMLANLAEDRQGRGEPGADVATALKQLEDDGIDANAALDLLDRALIVPVLTAHPTEVMRKSMIDHRTRIAELMRAARRGRDGDAERRCRRAGDRAPDRAAVADAPAAPRTHAGRGRSGDRALLSARRLPAGAAAALCALGAAVAARPAAFLRLGSWIGGDRDGNPIVTAETLRYALGASTRAVLTSYLAQVHALGKELSISTELARRRTK